MTDDFERRKADELFRLKIIEAQGELKALLTQNITEIRHLATQLGEQGLKISKIETALWGYPASEEAGLLEKNRNQNRKWALLLFFANVLAWGVISLIKPLYEHVIVDWIYNSPSEKYLLNHSRPKITHYHIKETPPE